MWFERLTGFREESGANVRDRLRVDGETMHSMTNGQSWTCGTLNLASLAELRAEVRACPPSGGKLTVSEVVGDVKDLHGQPENAGAFFQVASQFNLLEMAAPEVTPEAGVDIYEQDRTQGPACAIACGPGTIYRNYFIDVDGQIGQTHERQIDCLADLGIALGNTGQRLWSMQNGYALATGEGLSEIANRLNSATAIARDELRCLLRIGVHRNTQVTIGSCDHTVTQAYCSALPIGYSQYSANQWESFARLVLEGSYEAALCAAILNAKTTGNNKVFLTLLGGGVFANPHSWIFSALRAALKQYRDYPLEVAIISYGSSMQSVRDFTNDWQLAQ